MDGGITDDVAGVVAFSAGRPPALVRSGTDERSADSQHRDDDRSRLSFDDTGGAGIGATRAQSSDFAALRDVGKILKKGETLLLAVPNPVTQRWCYTFLMDVPVNTLPALGLSPDEDLPGRDKLYHGDTDAYVLLQAGAGIDLTAGSPPPPVWTSGKFQLVRSKELRNFGIVGTGWYSYESHPESAIEWQKHFRWVRHRAELLLFRLTPGYRLAFSVVSGYGIPSVAQQLRISGGKGVIARDEVRGAANLVSPPLVPDGPLTRLYFETESDDTKVIPRIHAIVNRRVPNDVRRLSFAISSLQLARETEVAGWTAPEALDFTTPAAWRATGLNGLHTDGWVARRANFPSGFAARGRCGSKARLLR